MNLLCSRRQKITRLAGLVLAGFLFYSCEEWLPEWENHPPTVSQESADVVYDWYKLIGQIQLRTSPQPNVIANNRSFGYLGVGLYEAVQPGLKGAVSLSATLYQMPAMPTPERNRGYVWGASANAALASLSKQLLVGLTQADRARLDSLETAYHARYSAQHPAAVVARSQVFGQAVAAAIYNWSTTDNFSISSTGYVLPVFPGAWVPTPPANASPVGPFLKNSRPFLASSATVAIPPMAVPYSEDTTSSFYAAAHEVYTISKSLTPEQKAIADHWADVGGVGVGVPGPGHLISIVTSVLQSQRAKLGTAAVVYAKTGIANKDAFIIMWRGKFQYNLLRPVTYLQRHVEAGWLPYLVTPPYPEYPSGLAGIYTPVLQVLLREFGDIPVTDNAYAWNGSAPRHYASITAAMEEAAISRIYGGIHYRFTQDATLAFGRQIGNTIADIPLLPK